MEATNIKVEQLLGVVNNELCVTAKITYTLSEDKEIEDSFFASIDTKEKEEDRYLLMCYLPSAKKSFAIDKNSVLTNDIVWFQDSSKVSFKLDKYPEELQPLINKGLNATKDILHKKSKSTLGELYDLDENLLDDIANELLKANDMIIKEIAKYKRIDGVQDLSDMLSRYKLRKHLLIVGEKGAGKTYSVDKMAKDEGLATVEIKGHEGIESIDLLGYYVKDEHGNLVWLDGVLSQAFRKAKDEPTILFFDELLRVPARELNILVGALTPMSDRTYSLRTNRIINVKDGIGESELISVPMDNLWVVGTTNIGSGYNVEDIDDALADRFRTVYKVTDVSELKDILMSCSSGKISESKIDSLISFYSKMKDMFEAGELEKQVNTRHLCETIQLSANDSEVIMYINDLIPTWVSTDTNGKPSKAEISIIQKIIKTELK